MQYLAWYLQYCVALCSTECIFWNAFWQSIKYFIWHAFWQSIKHFVWHALRQFIKYSTSWHPSTTYMTHIVTNIYTYSDMYSDILRCTSFVSLNISSSTLSGIYSHPSCKYSEKLCVIPFDMSVEHSIWLILWDILCLIGVQTRLRPEN